jgi:isopenicillin N synthase-like dioxygenase
LSAVPKPTPTPSFPIINIASLISAEADSAKSTIDAIARAAQDVGFFYITGHGCPADVGEALVRRAAQFFALPLEQKMEVYIGKSRNHRGYVPMGEEVFAAGTVDKKEAFDLSRDLAPDDPAIAAAPHLLGPNQWPELAGFAKDVSAYYGTMFTIGRRLMRAFARALGQEAGFFDPFITKPPSQLRLVHYPANPDATDEPGIGAHTDYECFTLLLATSPGLEVMNAKGEWMDAPPKPGAFVVNIGDLLEFWSGGRFVATTHRVRKVAAERYSFPLFFNVDYHTAITPLFGPKHRTLIAGDHLYGQTVQTFRYLQKRLADGEIQLPKNPLPLSSFGQSARAGA